MKESLRDKNTHVESTTSPELVSVLTPCYGCQHLESVQNRLYYYVQLNGTQVALDCT